MYVYIQNMAVKVALRTRPEGDGGSADPHGAELRSQELQEGSAKRAVFSGEKSTVCRNGDNIYGEYMIDKNLFG